MGTATKRAVAQIRTYQAILTQHADGMVQMIAKSIGAELTAIEEDVKTPTATVVMSEVVRPLWTQKPEPVQAKVTKPKKAEVTVQESDQRKTMQPPEPMTDDAVKQIQKKARSIRNLKPINFDFVVAEDRLYTLDDIAGLFEMEKPRLYTILNKHCRMIRPERARNGHKVWYSAASVEKMRAIIARYIDKYARGDKLPNVANLNNDWRGPDVEEGDEYTIEYRNRMKAEEAARLGRDEWWPDAMPDSLKDEDDEGPAV